MLSLQALSSSLNAGPAKGGAAWAEERRLGALRQSVPQNGRAHLQVLEIKRLGTPAERNCPEFFIWHEKRFETRENGSEKRSETWQKHFKPLSGRFEIFHQHFPKFFMAQNLQQKRRIFFHREDLQGWPR